MPHLNPFYIHDEHGHGLIALAQQLHEQAQQTYNKAYDRRASTVRGDRMKHTLLASAVGQGTACLEILELLVNRVKKLERDATMYRSSVQL